MMGGFVSIELWIWLVMRAWVNCIRHLDCNSGDGVLDLHKLLTLVFWMYDD